MTDVSDRDLALRARGGIGARYLSWFAAAYAPMVLRRGLESGLGAYGKWLYRHFATVAAPSRTIANMVAVYIQYRPRVISDGVGTDG